MKKETLVIFERLEVQRRDIIATYNLLSTAQLQFHPNENHWNLLQVLRHLVTAEIQSLKYIERKMRFKDEVQHTGISASVRNLILKTALHLPIKFKAPKVAEVKEKHPDFETMISEWDEVRSKFKELIETSDEETLKKALYKHPRAGLLNIKQAMEFIETHVTHHRKQMKKIMLDAAYPAV